MSKSSEDYLQVLHLGDPAHTATLLARAANETGRAWRVLPLAQNPQTASPVAQTLGRTWRGAWWEARLWGAKLSRPRIHLHSAMALPHVGWALGDYVLHLHGTDIRSRRYEPAYTNRIHDAVAHARQVFYSTPDLREHLTDWRPEARLIPVPVDLDCPAANNPYRCKARSTGSYVFFVSRCRQFCLVMQVQGQLQNPQRGLRQRFRRVGHLDMFANIVGLWPVAQAGDVTVFGNHANLAQYSRVTFNV